MEIKESAELVNRLIKELGAVFVGTESCIKKVLLGYLTGLHVLIEDIPGVGKTTLARTLAKAVDLDFGRIQFTPDLLPGDVLGMTIWSIEKKDFIFKKGAIMHQFVLADEINRASAQTQSALLEAMQEGAVTVDSKTYRLPEPFFVIATQNPVTFSGTFQLPEAQIDRFGISFSIGYPNSEDEIAILDRFQEENPIDNVTPKAKPEDITEIRKQVRKIQVNKIIKEYLVEIAEHTRKSPKIKLGMSPRATQHLLLVSQANALFSGRDFVIPEDITANANDVLAHRMILSAEARMENISQRDAVTGIIDKIKMPSGL
jgi:MoxR-like ATPase